MEVQHIYDKPTGFTEVPRVVIAPNGDYFTAFPADRAHRWGRREKVKEMTAYGSRDKGRSWEGPSHPWRVPYSQHAFTPIVDKNSRRIYTFGLERPFETMPETLQHSDPLAMRYSDDNGHCWSAPERIRPVNDPECLGVCHMQMCRTDTGTWLLGAYPATNIPKGSGHARRDRQQVVRSTDRGTSWALTPGPEHGGWYVEEFDRMLEGQVFALGGRKRSYSFACPRGALGRCAQRTTGSPGARRSRPRLFTLTPRQWCFIFWAGAWRRLCTTGPDTQNHAIFVSTGAFSGSHFPLMKGELGPRRALYSPTPVRRRIRDGLWMLSMRICW